MSDSYMQLSNLPLAPSIGDNDKVVVIVGNREYLLTKESLIQSLNGFTSDDKTKVNRLIIDGDGTRLLNNAGQYVTLNGITGYHSHENKTDVLDKLSTNESGELLFNGQVIETGEAYTLPTATIDTLGGVKIDGDTIKINDGVISTDVIGNWSANVQYPVGYFVVYEQNLYECIFANNDSQWDETHWLLIGNISGGTTINDWSVNTEYALGDLIIEGSVLYKCIEEHTSGSAFDIEESEKWVALSGEKGDKGEDGFTPTITSTVVSNGVDITITNNTGSQTVGIRNGIDGKSAYQIAIDTGTFVGTESEWLQTLKGKDGEITIQTEKTDITCTFLANGWNNNIPYTQTIAVEGINETLNPRIDVVISDNVITGRKEEQAFSYITRVITGNGMLTAYCYENKPEVDLNIMIEVV